MVKESCLRVVRVKLLSTACTEAAEFTDTAATVRMITVVSVVIVIAEDTTH
jgi:hypothetical protein